MAFVTSSWNALRELGGVGVYRALHPAMALRAAGHDVVICPDLAQDVKTGEIKACGFDDELMDGFDVIYHTAVLTQDFAESIKRAQAYGQKIVADVDDWMLGVTGDNMGFVTLQASQHNRERNVKHWLSSVANSDAAVYSTPFLREQMRGRVPASQPSVVIRNAIDLDAGWHQRQQAERPIYGWTGQVSWRLNDVKMMKGILGPFQEDYAVGLVHVGHRLGHPTFEHLTGTKAVIRVNVAAYEVYARSFTFDVGLVPLMNTPFNHSKSWLKRLEYGACKIPSIASVTDEQRAFGPWGLAKRPLNWTRLLARSVDLAWRTEHASLAYETARANSVRVRGQEWVDLVESVVR